MTEEPLQQDLDDLGALADGTLPAARVAEVEARAAASPRLQGLLELQRRSLRATAAAEADGPPAALFHSVAALARPRPRRGRIAALPWIAAALAVLAPIVVLVALDLRGPGAPTAAAAADFGLKPANAPSPQAGPRPGQLDVRVEGIAFPDLAGAFGWRAAGVRDGTVGSRPVTSVVYEKGDRRMAYVIVGGAALPDPPGAAQTAAGDVRFHTFQTGGRQAISWRRDGHTCVLVGAASQSELIAIAGWAEAPPAY